jgi:hypothetical protein
MLDRLGSTYHALGDSHRAQSAWRHAFTILDTLRRPDADAMKKKRDERHVQTAEHSTADGGKPSDTVAAEGARRCPIGMRPRRHPTRLLDHEKGGLGPRSCSLSDPTYGGVACRPYMLRHSPSGWLAHSRRHSTSGVYMRSLGGVRPARAFNRIQMCCAEPRWPRADLRPKWTFLGHTRMEVTLSDIDWSGHGPVATRCRLRRVLGYCVRHSRQPPGSRS